MLINVFVLLSCVRINDDDDDDDDIRVSVDALERCLSVNSFYKFTCLAGCKMNFKNLSSRSTCSPMAAGSSSSHATVTVFDLDLLSIGSMHAERLPQSMCVLSVVLIAQAVFSLESGHTDTHKVTDVTDHPYLCTHRRRRYGITVN